MKSDGLGAANKPGDGQTSKAKNVKKPADRGVAAKAKTASAGVPVVNGTGAAGARHDIASANGPRSSPGAKEHEKKPNPGARPKTSPTGGTSASQTAGTKAQKSSAGKADNTAGTTQAQPNTSSTSGSASPENCASSPRNDTHSVPGSHSLLTSLHSDWHQLLYSTSQQPGWSVSESAHWHFRDKTVAEIWRGLQTN